MAGRVFRSGGNIARPFTVCPNPVNVVINGRLGNSRDTKNDYQDQCEQMAIHRVILTLLEETTDSPIDAMASILALQQEGPPRAGQRHGTIKRHVTNERQ